MQNDNTKSPTCMACSCPCEMHKEHNHPVEGENKSDTKVCKMCGMSTRQTALVIVAVSKWIKV